MKTLVRIVTLLTAGLAAAAEPTAAELLAKYDAVMAPKKFEVSATMTAHREDGSARTYELRLLKGDEEKLRVWFNAPSSVKGQEMLRSGDNLWVYLPNLKRATRIANRDSFQGGDFNNADVLRGDYAKDYDAKVGPSDVPDVHLLELKAKHKDTSYDAIKLWVRKDGTPVKGQYFATSGQLLRSAEFLEPTEFQKGYRRPALARMRNELVPARYSELRFKAMKLDIDVPAQRFTQSDLGR
jgi:outer membrane lipoprotein-sorting protein